VRACVRARVRGGFGVGRDVCVLHWVLVLRFFDLGGMYPSVAFSLTGFYSVKFDEALFFEH
jgi:hypothetical protein